MGLVRAHSAGVSPAEVKKSKPAVAIVDPSEFGSIISSTGQVSLPTSIFGMGKPASAFFGIDVSDSSSVRDSPSYSPTSPAYSPTKVAISPASSPPRLGVSASFMDRLNASLVGSWSCPFPVPSGTRPVQDTSSTCPLLPVSSTYAMGV